MFLFGSGGLSVMAQDAGESIMSSYSIAGCRYWFDNSAEVAQTSYSNGKITLDVSTLGEGFHTLHYQVIDSRGEVSPAYTSPFFRLQQSDEQFKDYTIEKIRYWFDKDYTPREAAYTAGTSSIDVSTLGEGFHTLHYQILDSRGEVSPAHTSPFFRLQPDDEKFKDYTVQTVRYWIDNDTTTIRTEAFVGGATTLDLSGCGEGAHTLSCQVVTDDGQVSPVLSATADRWIYDIYVSKSEEYDADYVESNSLFAARPDMKLHYATDDVSIRGHLTVDEGTTASLGKFVQTVNLGRQTSNGFTKTGADYYHPTTLINNGFMRADSVIVRQNLYRDRWHFISLPFNAKVSEVEVPEGTYWALRQYDGEARAQGMQQNTWVNLESADMMVAGHGYIMQLTNEGNDNTSCVTFKSVNDTRKNNIFTVQDVTVELEEHQAEFEHNRDWNLIGNPYPSFFDTRMIDSSGIIIAWNGNSYTAYSLIDDEYILMPFEAFFFQKPLDKEAVTFSREGRQHTHEVISREAAKGAERHSLSLNYASRRILNFTLADGETTHDRSRVVINERAAMGYESDKDAPKFMEATPQTAQLFSIDSGVQYAINERPEGNGLVTFSVYAPADGEYSFALSGNTEGITVFDTESREAWALSDGPYIFSATQGMHAARLVVSLNGNATSPDMVNAYNDGEVQVAGGELQLSFAKAKNIRVFSIDGRQLYNSTTANATVPLKSGVYMVSINGETTKITIK